MRAGAGVVTERGRAVPADAAARHSYGQRRTARAHAVLADRQRERDAALAQRLGFPTLSDWYRQLLAEGATTSELLCETGKSEKWLRRVRRLERAQRPLPP